MFIMSELHLKVEQGLFVELGGVTGPWSQLPNAGAELQFQCST